MRGGKKVYDISGQRFGRLVAVKYAFTKSHNSYWECLCDCGNLKIVAAHSLKRGNTTSCGCYRREVTKEMKSTHGKYGTREYTIWAEMKARCTNFYDKDYGGRGIKYDPKWETFEGFWEDMEEGYSDTLSIDRINVNGNYEKLNCRWATSEQQANNARSNLNFTYKGITLTISQWGKLLGIPHDRIRQRLRRGWTFEDAITKPIQYNGK